MTARAKAKRPNGDGSLYQRKSDGRWYGTRSYGRDPETGKWRRATVSGATKEEARRKLAELQAMETAELVERHAAKDEPAPAVVTVGEVLVDWLESKRPNIAPTTYRNYRMVVHNHLVPTLGDVPLSELTARDVDRLLSTKHADGVSPVMRRLIYDKLHAGLAYAKRLGEVDRNVVDDVDRPRVPRKVAESFDWDERTRILGALWSALAGALRPEDGAHYPGWVAYAPMFLLAAYTGLRQGELLALKWSAIDLDKRVVRVVENYRRDGSFSAPKSRAGQRPVYVDDDIVAMLRDLRTGPLVSIGTAGAGDGLVFARAATGKPPSSRSVLRAWDAFQASVGLTDGEGRRCFHTLRKVYASALVESGVPATAAQRLLGHATAAVTLELYANAHDGLLEAAPDQVREMYGRSFRAG